MRGVANALRTMHSESDVLSTFERGLRGVQSHPYADARPCKRTLRLRRRFDRRLRAWERGKECVPLPVDDRAARSFDRRLDDCEVLVQQ